MNRKIGDYISGILVISLIMGAPVRGLCQAPTISYPASQTYNVGTAVSLVPITTGTAVANGLASTFAGTGSAGMGDGVGTAASFDQPLGTAVDLSGNVYIADAGSHLIRKISPSGNVVTIAGTAGFAGFTNGTGTAASFSHPVGLAVDAAGNIYVADENNNAIRKITPAGGVTTVAGTGGTGNTNGALASATFNQPCGVAVDASGNIYVADYSNNVIRKITISTGTVTTFAGSGSVGSTDGVGTAASFNHPFSVAIDQSGNIYVADRLNFKIRKITAAGSVTTLAGNGTQAWADGAGTSAEFNAPTTVTVDKVGNVYVADEGNNCIRMVTAAGTVSTLSGTRTAGSANGIGSSATFYYPFAVAADASGFLYVGDYMNNLVRRVDYGAFTITPTVPAGLSFDPTNSTKGKISGIPTAVSPSTTYTATAYNSSGSSSVTFAMAINPAAANNASSNQNYIATYSPRDSLLSTSTALYSAATDPTQVETVIQYFDGLGRPLQTVQVKGSPAGKDIVEPVAYDQFGREAAKYLPYSYQGTADGSYKADAFTSATTSQANFYKSPQTPAGVTPISSPQAVTAFESSPLNRVIEQGAPGDSWQLTGTTGLSGTPGHTVKTAYGSNTGTDNVINWVLSTSANGGATGGTNYYGTNKLYKTTTTDENGNNTIEFKDNMGKVVCKRDAAGNSTYYVYNDLNLLAYVIPPIPAASYPTSFTELDAVFLNYIYGYHYDGRSRLVEKNIPGKGWEYMLYNALDEQVATQDAVQRSKSPQEWTFMKYDEFSRPVLRGVFTYAGTVNANSRVAVQGLVVAVTTLWETPTTTGNGYTSAAWPLSWTGATLGINYYDNYTGIPSLPSGYNTTASISSMTRGLQTASLTNVLGTNNMLWKVNYFDDYGRVVKDFNQHYLGGVLSPYNYDAFTTTYDFSNEMTNLSRLHYKLVSGAASLALTIANKYVYDQMGRKTQTWEQINSGTNYLLSQNDYNEVGQLMTKHLHSSTGTAPYLQNTSYAYNERGWLSKINDPTVTPTTTTMFAEQINYNVVQFAGAAKFNGDIAETNSQVYQSLVPGQQHTVYTYDALDRLNAGVAGNTTSGLSESAITYDNLGNIKTLTRSGTGNGTLSYTYTGNFLSSISGFKSGSYTPDKNGNVVTDGPRGNTITYNMLNLPQTVTGSVNDTYTYDANGTKLRKVNVAGGVTTVTDYIEGIQYKTNSTVIDFVQTEEGRAINTGSSWNYEYTLKDHLGNNRVTFDQITGKVGEDDYYPFGLNVHRLANATNNYLYNGKELQEELGVYDYGHRQYDPVIGRFTSVDAYAEKYAPITPYQYGANNPISNIDMNGDSIRVNTTLSIPIPGVGNINVNTSLYYQGGTAYYQNGTAYNGNDPFVAQLGTALSDLSQGSVGKALVNDLEGSTNNTTILNDSRGQGNLTADDGSQVRWNPNGTAGGPDQNGSTTRPSFIGLGHEFAHVQDVWGGTIDRSSWYSVTDANGNTVGSVSNAEKYATYVENQIRGEHGLSLREFYSPTASGGGYEPSRILNRGTSVNKWIYRDPNPLTPAQPRIHIIISPAQTPTILRP